MAKKNEQTETEKKPVFIPSPKQIYNHLNEYVIGQEEAKRILSVAVYNHYKRFLINNYGALDNSDGIEIEKSNILMLGNTGTGKTHLIKTVAKFLGVPCYIADSTKFSSSGYVGDDVENCLVGLLRACDFDIPAAEMGIVVLDEIDKLATKSENPSITRDVGGECVQQELLKIVEGGKVSVPPQGGRKHPQQETIEIDTTNILFIGLGAFAGLDKMIMRRCNKSSVGYNNPTEITSDKVTEDNYLSKVETEDLRRYGLIPEFLGRFPIVTHTNPLKVEDLIKILTEPKNAITKQYQKLLSVDNINLTFSKDALSTIANIAINNKTGARGLRKIIENVLTDIMFEYGGTNSKVKKVAIDNKYLMKYYPNLIIDNNDKKKKAA